MVGDEEVRGEGQRTTKITHLDRPASGFRSTQNGQIPGFAMADPQFSGQKCRFNSGARVQTRSRRESIRSRQNLCALSLVRSVLRLALIQDRSITNLPNVTATSSTSSSFQLCQGLI